MKFNEVQLNWINSHKDLIDESKLDEIRKNLIFEFIEPQEKRQLFAALAILFDLPLEILKARKIGNPQIFYPLYINGMGDRIKLVEWGCLGEPSKSNILDGISSKLVENGIDGEVLQKIKQRMKYDVD